MLGVDFGGTRIKAGVVEGAEVVRELTRDTPARAGPAEVLQAIAALVGELATPADQIGLAIPGEVDEAGRCYRLANVPGFEGVNIAEELAARVGSKVLVENDATSAALAEQLFGHGARYQSFVLLTLGTGIGGGVVIDGRVRRGRHGFAGEVGHIVIDRSPNAWPCNCGLTGCMEAYAGTRGLLRSFREAGGDASEVREIADSARRGEPAGLKAFELMGRALGLGIANIQNLLDLDALVFSGGVAQSFDLIEPSLRPALEQRVFGQPAGQVPLLVSELGPRAGVIGAAHLGQLR